MSLPQRCPRCWASRVQLALQRGQTNTFSLDACSQCGGVWLDRQAAQRVLSDSPAQPTGQPPSLFCPCCDQGMAPHTVPPSGMVVDACGTHGVWFDAHELDAICAAAAQRKGLKVPARVAAGATVLAAAAAAAATAVAVADMSSSDDASSGTSPGDVALDMGLTAPETVYFGAEAVGGAVSDVVGGPDLGDAAEGAGDLVGAAAEGAGDWVEAGVETGSTVLEAVTGLLGALFD